MFWRLSAIRLLAPSPASTGSSPADGTLQGEGAYVRYEMWLRDLETRFYSLVGLSGSFFAARRSVCQQWDDRVQSDFGTALSCVQAGYARGLRPAGDRLLQEHFDTRKEYRRKLRTVTRGMGSLRIRAEVLNIFRYGRFSLEVFSHKVMRWATPWFLLAALGTNVALAIQSSVLPSAARPPARLVPLTPRNVDRTRSP